MEPGPLVFDGAAKFVALFDAFGPRWPPRTEERVECRVNLLAMSATPMVSWATTVRPSAVRKSAPAPRARTIRAFPGDTPRGGNAASSRSRRCLRVSVSTAEENVATSSTRMATVEENKGVVYPSNLRCALQVNVPTPEVDDTAYSLSNYMRLPVDQYVGIELPMGAEMKRVPGDSTLFQLEIPGLKFLSLEVKPVVRVRVRLIGDGEEVLTWTGQSGYPGGKTPEWRAEEAARLAELAIKAECVDDDDEPEECPAPPPATGSSTPTTFMSALIAESGYA